MLLSENIYMNFKKLAFVAGILLLLLSCFQRTLAQTLPQNLSNYNIEDINDQTLIGILQRAQAAGLTDAELVQQAQSRGLPAGQASILQTRIRDLRSKQSVSTADNTEKTDTSSLANSGRQLNYKPDSTDTVQLRRQIFDRFKPQIFLSDLFRNKKLSFTPNLKIATPVNYVIGPEDQLSISVYGKSLVNWKLIVSPEGNINIPGAGIVNVAGRSFEQAISLIKARLIASGYAIGSGTSVQVTLGNIRSIKVIVSGQVYNKGTYTLPSLATAFNALYYAGGPNENGSYRQIQVIRDNRVIRTIDIYDFGLRGSLKNDINLHDQDVIYVPTYRTRVQVAGEVKIPALFEVLPGETLATILKYAGGFTDQAYTSRIKVTQVSDQQKRITDIVENDYDSYIPLRGDKYVVGHILDRYENRVTIAGAVFRPGEYELQKGLTVSGLIANATGLKEDAFTGRGSITRLKPDNTTELVPFNIQAILNKTEPDITLQREDVVTISSIFDLRDNYSVAIKGDVRHAGDFAYSDNMSVEDLIIKAGGFAEGASKMRIEVARRIDNSDPTSRNSPVAQVFSVDADPQLQNSKTAFKLKPFDIVSVYSLPGYEKQKTVKVEGEVLYPGNYTIQKKNERISDLVKRAGGLAASADVDGGSLRRNNIAILGIEKNRADTAAIQRERRERLSRLRNSYTNAGPEDTTGLRNNYVGINLKEILANPGSDIDILLEDGDVLRIPKQQQIVRVNGEVLYPSAVVYSNSKSFKEYVYNAGGFSPGALKRGAYVVYPNGTVRATHKFVIFNVRPKVRPGSEIYVPKKPAGINNIAQILAFTSGLASLGAIILGILSVTK